MLVIVLKNIFVSHVDLDGRREEVSHSSLWTVKTDSLKRNDKKHILETHFTNCDCAQEI